MLFIALKILPLFLVIFLGSLFRILNIADDSWVAVLNNYALHLAFPAMIIGSFLRIENAGIGFRLFYINSAILFFISLLIIFSLKLLKLSQEKINTFLICITFGNVGYLGIPFVSLIVNGSAEKISIVLGSTLFIIFTFNLWYIEKSSKNNSNIFLKLAKNPLILSVALGILVNYLRIRLPGFIISTISLVSGSGSAVALFAIGIFLVKEIKINKEFFDSLIISALKLAALPALFIIAAKYFSLPYADMAVSVIESGMPVAITPFALAEAYNLNKKTVLYSIILSTGFSIISLPILSALVLR